MKKRYLVLIVGMTLFSCVTKKKYDSLNVKKSKLEVANSEKEDELDLLTADNQKLSQTLANYSEEIERLKNDTIEYGKLHKELLDEYTKLSKITAAELQDKLHEMANLRKSLIEKDNKLNADQQKISRLETDLEERERRVSELEEKIAQQQKAVNELKRSINEALLSFNEDELTVEMKNGKVYVSLSNQLLFKPGSYNVDTKGVGAINKLADVVKSNAELELIVEGHTDDVPYSGSGQLVDNWDLSVKRATSITRLLQDRGVNPKQIAASGRSQYNPKATGDSKEARSVNRRIEIIISPNLDSLFEIIK